MLLYGMLTLWFGRLRVLLVVFCRQAMQRA
jgi:hypothetical protein